MRLEKDSAAQMNMPPSHAHCSASSWSSISSQSQLSTSRISRCVDCKKPLFTRTWKEKLKSQIRTKFQWPSKKKQESSSSATGGRYIVKQRCGECQQPLRCSECSEAFFANLTPDEIKVFIKAMVLFAMKGLCGNCNHAFRFVYDELFETPGNSAAENGTLNGKVKSLGMKLGGAETLSEIEALDEGSPVGKDSIASGSESVDPMDWKSSEYMSDWRREMSELLGNRFQLVLER